jgi:hypothetical protein
MARTDIARLLTGMPSSRPDPMGMGINSEQQRLAFGAQRAEGLQRGMRGLMGGDTMTPSEQLQMAMAQLDLSKPEDLRKLAGIQQATGDLTGAAKTAAGIRELGVESDTRNALAEALDKLGRPQEAEQVRNKTLDLKLAQSIVLNEQKLAKEKEVDTKQRGALLRLAKSQKNPRAEEWLNSGGDVSTIASVLLKDPSLAKAEAFTTMYEGDKAIRVGIINGTLHKATDKGWEVIPDDVKLSGTAPVKVTERKPTSVAVTKEDKKAYNAVLSENPEIAANLDTSFRRLDVDQKTILIDKAHQIWKNADPAISREAALRQAAGVTKKEDFDTFGTVKKG